MPSRKPESDWRRGLHQRRARGGPRCYPPAPTLLRPRPPVDWRSPPGSRRSACRTPSPTRWRRPAWRAARSTGAAKRGPSRRSRRTPARSWSSGPTWAPSRSSRVLGEARPTPGRAGLFHPTAPSPSFALLDPADVVRQSWDGGALAVINGAFFETPGQPSSQVAFPLATGGFVVTGGSSPYGPGRPGAAGKRWGRPLRALGLDTLALVADYDRQSGAPLGQPGFQRRRRELRAGRPPNAASRRASTCSGPSTQRRGRREPKPWSSSPATGEPASAPRRPWLPDWARRRPPRSRSTAGPPCWSGPHAPARSTSPPPSGAGPSRSPTSSSSDSADAPLRHPVLRPRPRVRRHATDAGRRPLGPAPTGSRTRSRRRLASWRATSPRCPGSGSIALATDGMNMAGGRPPQPEITSTDAATGGLGRPVGPTPRRTGRSRRRTPGAAPGRCPWATATCSPVPVARSSASGR